MYAFRCLLGCRAISVSKSYFRGSFLKASFRDTFPQYSNSDFFSYVLLFLFSVSIADERTEALHVGNFGPLQVHELYNCIVVRATEDTEYYYMIIIHRVTSI